jgi:hypothetical protein
VCWRKKSGKFSTAAQTLNSAAEKGTISQRPRCNSGFSEEVRMRFVVLIILLSACSWRASDLAVQR